MEVSDSEKLICLGLIYFCKLNTAYCKNDHSFKQETKKLLKFKQFKVVVQNGFDLGNKLKAKRNKKNSASEAFITG